MIARVWRGTATRANADKYEDMMRREIMPAIVARRIPGFVRVELLRRDAGDEIELLTLTWFDSMDAIKAFMPGDHETAFLPDKLRAVLTRWDDKVQHFALRERRDGG